MLKSYQNAFIFLSLFVFMQALVWFHITSCWHMLCCKPIRVFIHVWSHWPVPLWRGWPHASLSPMLCTIWQWGLFFFHPFFSVSLQSDCFLFLAFISSGSDYFLSLFFSGVDTLDLTKRCFHTNTHILLPWTVLEVTRKRSMQECEFLN